MLCYGLQISIWDKPCDHNKLGGMELDSGEPVIRLHADDPDAAALIQAITWTIMTWRSIRRVRPTGRLNAGRFSLCKPCWIWAFLGPTWYTLPLPTLAS